MFFKYKWFYKITGISAKQGIISISETYRNHMGQDLGNAGGEAK